MPPISSPAQDASRRRQWVVAVGCLLASLLALNLPPAPREAIREGLRLTALQPFLALHGGLVVFNERVREVDRLRAQVDSLTAELVATGAIEAELEQLREVDGLRGVLGPSFVPAIVVRSGTAGSQSAFMLRGPEGVRLPVGAPVVTPAGLLGIVRESAGPGSAVGIDWTHPDFRASAISADATLEGIVLPLAGGFREEDWLELQSRDFHVVLDAGTRVVTSGGGGLFPRGIPLGEVIDVSMLEEGWRRDYRLRPFVSPATVTHALVAIDVGGAEVEGAVSSVWPTGGGG